MNSAAAVYRFGVNPFSRFVLFALVLLTFVNNAVRADEPAAASAAFLINDSVVRQARELLVNGKYMQAEELLRGSIGETETDKSAVQARTELLEIIRRMRWEYSLTRDELLAKVQKIVPTATQRDVHDWLTESRVGWRSIDGTDYFNRREPQNIFLYSPTAQRRREASGGKNSQSVWILKDHLEKVVAEGEKSSTGLVVPVRHRVTHTLTIRANHPDIKTGSVVRVWLPFAQEYRQQQDVKLLSTSPPHKLVAPNGIDGNPVQGAPQRTVYFEVTVQDPSQPLKFREDFEYTSWAYYPKLDEAKVEPLPADWNNAYLTARMPHLPLDPRMHEHVKRIVGAETNPLVKARKIFRWVSENIPWFGEDEYCTIESLALKGYLMRRGDCGVQNSVFIAMCRLAGIPARWQSGFETKPGENWGMHDWAEIYIAPWGWIPADASYGLQPSADPRLAEFYCGHQDSYRLIVNLDWGRELHPPKSSFRSEPADFQRGEVEVDGKNLYYDSWTTKTEVMR